MPITHKGCQLGITKIYRSWENTLSFLIWRWVICFIELFVIIGMKGIAMKQIFKSREKLWVSLIIAFAVLLVTPQLFTRKVILGSDSIFHYNRFYEAAMQLKNGNFSYFLSLYGFQQSGRIVNALYDPFLPIYKEGLF